MARWAEPEHGDEQAYLAWVATRPDVVRAVAERFRPWELYRLKSTGHRVYPLSFGEAEDGTVTLTVAVTGEFNLITFDRQVFGIKPDDLEPCELPSEDEITGALMTHEQVDENIDALRVMARPDLWVMGEDGKAVRKQ